MKVVLLSLTDSEAVEGWAACRINAAFRALVWDTLVFFSPVRYGNFSLARKVWCQVRFDLFT